MEPFFIQAFTLLTSDTGSLAFHLVLAFSILGALQITLSYNRGKFNPVSRRLVFGFAGLLILQILLFVISGLGWQGLVDSNKLLPPVDRSVMLLSTVLIAWMWLSIQPSRLVDTVAVVLLVLIVVGSALGCVWWINQPEGLSFNGSVIDLMAQFTQMAILLSGGITLWIMHPAGWGSGVCMLSLMFLGSLMQVLFPQVQGDYSGAVRLSLIAAYPFLLLLPQRAPEVEAGHPDFIGMEVPVPVPDVEDERIPEAGLLQLISQMVLESDPEQSARLVVSSMADFSGADLCLFIKIVDEEEVAVVSAGYDRKKNVFLEKIAIPVQGIPVFVSSYRLGRMRHLKLVGSSTEVSAFTRALDLPQLGNMLLLPVLSQDGQPIAGLLLINPYSDVDWTSDEQSRYLQFARVLVYLLQHTEDRLAVLEEIGQSQTMLRLVQEQAKQNGIERQKLMHQLLVLQQERGVEPPFLVSLEEKAHSGFDNEESSAMKLDVMGDSNKKSQTAGDLRIALEEIIRLKADLAEAEDRRAGQPQSTGSTQSTPAVFATIISIAEDIHASARAVLENNRLFLEETSGVLDTSQRKFVDRINLAANRLTHLAGELFQQTWSYSGQDGLNLQELDLIALVKKAVLEISELVEEFKIQLEQENVQEPLVVYSSSTMLPGILLDLLKHAIRSAGEEGQVGIHLELQRADGKQDFVLVQISDSGQAYEQQDLQLLFSPLLQEDQTIDTKVQDVDLPTLKSRVEAINGKIWVDSEVGKGNVFSLLLPVSAEEPLGIS